MPDVFTKAKRSEVMARIRSRGNRDTELALARLFRAHGIKGWRRQKAIVICSSQRQLAHSESRSVKTLARSSIRADSRRLLRVKPDFVFPKLRLAVFVDGCFWHACPLHATKPRNNAAFWRRKLAANQARDRKVNRVLRAANWRVLRIWEHELKKSGKGMQRQSTPHPGPLPGRGGEGITRLVTKFRKALTTLGTC